MRKVLFTFLLLAALINKGYSQEVTLDSINNGFTGVYPDKEGRFICTYDIREKAGTKDMSELVVHVYKQMLDLHGVAKIEVSKNSFVVQSSNHMGLIFFIIGNESKKTFTKIMMETDGKIVKKEVESVPASAFLKENYPKIYPIMPDGFIIVSKAPEKGGYKIERFDREMNSKWAKTYSPEKGSWEVVASNALMDRFVVLRKQKTGQNEYLYELQCLQIEIGDEMFSQPVKKGDDFGFPEFIKTRDDLIILGGFHYKDGVYKENAPSGMFFTHFGSAGDQRTFVTIPWDTVVEKVGGSLASELASGQSGLFLQDIPGTFLRFTAITEVYSKIKGGKEPVFKIGDFILFNITDPGELQTTRIFSFPKTHREITIKGETGGKSNHQLAQLLYHNNMFSYRHAKPLGNLLSVVYKDEDTAVMSALHLHLKDSLTNEKPAFEAIERHPKIQPALKPNKYLLDLSNGNNELNPFMYREVNAFRQGFSLYYYYAKPKLTIWSSPVL